MHIRVYRTSAGKWCFLQLEYTLCFTYYILMKSVNRSLEFLRRVSRRRRSAQRSVASISEYLEQSAALLMPEHLDDLRTALPLLNLQFATIEAPQFPHLQHQLKLLADFFEDTADGVFPAASEASRKETAFTLRYAAKELIAYFGIILLALKYYFTDVAFARKRYS
jgi:hypothetical protein